MGLVNFEEPFARLFNQGMITKEGYRDPSANMSWVPLPDVEWRDGNFETESNQHQCRGQGNETDLNLRRSQ